MTGRVLFYPPDPGAYVGIPRFIPNDDLGVELYAGFDWELLDGFRFRMDLAYWQPGEWFKHACVSALAPDGSTNSALDLLTGYSIGPSGVYNPYRDIDPVLAFWLSAQLLFLAWLGATA